MQRRNAEGDARRMTYVDESQDEAELDRSVRDARRQLAMNSHGVDGDGSEPGGRSNSRLSHQLEEPAIR